MTAAQDRIWDYYQNQSPTVFDENTGRLRYILGHLSSGMKVLDIGVGNGTFEELALAKGVEVHALDPSSTSIETLKKHTNLGDKAKVGYSQAIPFPELFFDAVVMSEVLEHLSEEALGATLKEVMRVLKPSAIFVGTVPSREDITQSLVVCPHCGDKFHRWGHQRSYTPESLRGWLSVGFDVNCIIERKFITLERRAGLAWLLALGRLLINRLGVRIPDESLFFLARKRE